MTEPKTDQELKQLAMGILAGTVFTDRHVPKQDQKLVSSIFMPLIFMDEKSHKDFTEQQPGLLYEDLNKAGPRGVNGYPIFSSMRFLTQEETERLDGFYKELQDFQQNWLQA